MIGCDDSDFAEFVDTARAVLFRETNTSGTTEGLASIAGQLAKDGVLGMIPGGSALR